MTYEERIAAAQAKMETFKAKMASTAEKAKAARAMKKEEIAAAMQELSIRRREKQPLEYPSAGSTFKRPEGYFAGKLIQDSGLAGYRIGGAEVSAKHCGFVINRGGATSEDIYQLIRHIIKTVDDTFHVVLEPEVRILGEF